MPNSDLPIIDLGNYPVIFASSVARIDKIGNGLVSVVMVEDRKNEDGAMERIIVARLIRPIASMAFAAQQIAKAIGASGVEEAVFVASDSPAGVQ